MFWGRTRFTSCRKICLSGFMDASSCMCWHLDITPATLSHTLRCPSLPLTCLSIFTWYNQLTHTSIRASFFRGSCGDCLWGTYGSREDSWWASQKMTLGQCLRGKPVDPICLNLDSESFISMVSWKKFDWCHGNWNTYYCLKGYAIGKMVTWGRREILYDIQVEIYVCLPQFCVEIHVELEISGWLAWFGWIWTWWEILKWKNISMFLQIYFKICYDWTWTWAV
jgi:hypothetical protein